MNHTFARRSTWVVIALVLLIGGGAYFWFRTGAAVTVGSDAPSFQADLKNTLALQAGVGSPTFTRATTATVTDFEGLIKTAKSGEARFEGARRVENLLVSSLPKAIYENQVIGHRITTSTIYPNTAYTFSMWVKRASGTGKFFIDNDFTVFSSSLGPFILSNLTVGQWTRLSVTVTSGSGAQSAAIDNGIGGSGSYSYTYNYGTAPDGTQTSARIVRGSDDYEIWGEQLEMVQGQANQNPSEYVSVGVLSAPYHGANVDGVKYFTTQNGNTVASNVVTNATGAVIPDATLHGYVAEGTRTNSILQSQTLETTWQSTGFAIANNVAIAPDGTNSADSITSTTSGGYSSIFQAVTTTSGVPYTYTVYAKPKTVSTLSMEARGALSQPDVKFSLTGAGSVILGEGIITALPNGWYKCSFTKTTIGVSTIFIISTNNVIVSVGNSIYLWGAQMEAGAFASSYIPTTSAAVTRNRDVLTYPVTGNVSASAGTLFAEVTGTEDPSLGRNECVVGLKQENGYSNFLDIRRNTSFYAGTEVYTGGNPQAVFSVGSSGARAFKAALVYGVNNIRMSSNGSSVVSDTSATLFTPYYFFVGLDSSTNGSLFGTIRNVKIWKKALTDTQLQNLTSTTTAVSQSAVQKTTIKATGITTINVAQNTKLIDGIVGMWSFNGPDISGATAFDRSGQGHDATLVNRPAPSQGKVAQGLSFNGTTHSATIGSAYNGVKTISFWVKPTTTTQPLIDLNGTATVDINSGTIRGNTFSTPTIYADGAPISTVSNTSWHFIALTTDTGINASNMTIGKIASTYFSGTLDEVRLYDRALSANEVWQLYSLGTSAFECGASSVRDADGNAYATVQVGTQCWMASNLKVGTRIAGASSQTNNSVIEKYCYADTDANCLTDGGLYQWDEAMQYSTTEGARGICPAGWHIPSDAQQNILDQYLTDSGQTCDAARSNAWDCSTAGTKLKTGGTSGMNIPLAGYRDTDGSFGNRAATANVWSSLQSGGDAWNRALYSGDATVYRSLDSKALGFSVRCLKD